MIAGSCVSALPGSPSDLNFYAGSAKSSRIRRLRRSLKLLWVRGKPKASEGRLGFSVDAVDDADPMNSC